MGSYVQELRKKIGHAPLIMCGASVIVYKNNKILLQKRRDNGCYTYPGGAVELYEDVRVAAARELLEETGLVAVELKLFDVFSGEGMEYTYPNGDQVSNVDIVFTCSEFEGKILEETDETLECRWFEIDNLPEEICPPIVRPLNEFLKVIKRT